MNKNHHSLLLRLKHSLQLLAMPAQRQLDLLPNFVVKADEIALEFTHWYDAAISNIPDVFTSRQVAALQSIDNLLNKMSEQKNASLWTDEALQNQNEWAQVRLLAKTALHEFQWEIQEPPNYQYEFVPGKRTQG